MKFSKMMGFARFNKVNPRCLKLSGLTLWFMFVTVSLGASGVREWPHVESDLDPDPAIRFGVLENGLRYAIRQNQEPPGRVSLRLLVQAGSLMEEDSQRGLAHYLEHIGFKGTRNFSPGEMIELGQRLGMAFGPDTNAHTSFHETVYKFDVPSVGDELLHPAFQALRDYADGMLILEEEVNSERGVILAEKRDRDSARYRALQDNLHFSMPYSLIPDRLPIGVDDTLKTATYQDLRDFYERWYTADRMMVVVVGDMDPDRAASLVELFFEDLEKSENPLQDPDYGSILSRGEAYSFYHDPQLTATEANIFSVRRAGGGDTRETRARDLVRRLAMSMLNRRFEIIARAEEAPFISAEAYVYPFLNFTEFVGLQAVTRPEAWEAAVERVRVEKRRVLEYGFLESELAVARANLLNSYERAAAEVESRESRQIADALVRNTSLDRVLQSPEQELALARVVLEGVTVEDCHAAFSALWEDADALVRLESEVAVEDAYKAVRNAFRAGSEGELDPPEDSLAGDFAYAEVGEPSGIVHREVLEGLDATQVVFGNNVVLNFKQTDFERNQISIGVRFGTGRLGLTPEAAGLDTFASGIFTAGALEAHSADDLKVLFAGKMVGAGFRVDDDAFVLSGSTTPEDLEDQLKLMAAYILAPGFRPEAERRFRRSIPQMYQQVNHTIDGVVASRVARYLVAGDPRFGLPERAVLESHTTESVREWMSHDLARGTLELAVVGDFDPEALLQAVHATFGALPERERAKPLLEDARRVDLQPGGVVETFSYRSSIPQARTTAYWLTDDSRDIRRARRLGVLAGVMRERMRQEIRVALGEAYSPYAYHDASRVFEGMGHLVAVVGIEPSKTEHIGEILDKIAASILEEGIDEDEFDRVLNPNLRALELQYRSNGYWLGSVLLGAHENPDQLDWARSLFDDFPSITRSEIEDLAVEYLHPENRILVHIKPLDLEPVIDLAGEE